MRHRRRRCRRSRRPNGSPNRATASMPPAAISTPPLAPPPIQSATTPLRRCRKAPMRPSSALSCKRRAYRRIPRRAGSSTSATTTPMCNSASTASCCPMASPVSAAFSTLTLSAASRSLPARCRPNTDCARWGSSTSPRATTFSTIPAASAITAAAAAPSSRVSTTAARTVRRAPRPPPQSRRLQQRPVSVASSISSPGAICRPPKASKIRCRRSTPSTIFPARRKVSLTHRRSSTPIRA